MKPKFPVLVIGLLGITFWTSVYFIGFFQTIIHTIIIVSITLIISKLRGQI